MFSFKQQRYVVRFQPPRHLRIVWEEDGVAPNHHLRKKLLMFYGHKSGNAANGINGKLLYDVGPRGPPSLINRNSFAPPTKIWLVLSSSRLSLVLAVVFLRRWNAKTYCHILCFRALHFLSFPPIWNGTNFLRPSQRCVSASTMAAAVVAV